WLRTAIRPFFPACVAAKVKTSIWTSGGPIRMKRPRGSRQAASSSLTISVRMRGPMVSLQAQPGDADERDQQHDRDGRQGERVVDEHAGHVPRQEKGLQA